jgi:transglutaminase-like putative cysteine protease
MRQASWEELFREGEAKEEKPPVWTRFAIFSWEEPVTLAIVMVGFLTVVQSMSSANWVNDMPSLYPIAFLGLAFGLVMSRVRVNEILVHLMALTIGVVGVFLAVASKMTGTYQDRAQEIYERFGDWLNAATTGGISNDNLPFILLVVSTTYLAAYIAAWAIFRWHNAWIGIVPGGLALLTNISYLPGQNSFPLLIYLFCAILLVARVNLLRRVREWRESRTRYPDLISLHVLNVTVWVALGLLALAWVLPTGSGSGKIYTVWDAVTSPVSGPLSSLNRVFISVNSKKGSSIHSFGSTMPLLGEINLGGGEIMRVTAQETGYLRAQSYDVYTAQGWKIGPSSVATTGTWPALKALQSPEESRRQLRRPVSIQVTTSRAAGVIVSEGDPLAVSVDSRVVYGADQGDVTSIRPTSQLKEGAQYRVDSTISNASVQRLQSAPTNYAPWVQTYLALPQDLPRRVLNKSRETVQGMDNPYDKANAIEQYLRTFTVDTKIQAAPARRDSVDYFLFTSQRGYFDYHASAMVVMLRATGVPSRLAVGYTLRPQDRIPDTNVYVLSEANAFAWPEVYFPGLGWVEFNPTPSEPKVNRSGQDDLPFTDGTGEEFIDESLLPNDLPLNTEPAAEAVDALEIDEGSSLFGRIVLTVILCFMALTLVAFLGFNYAWQRGLAGQPFPVQVWEKTLRLARWSRVRPTPQETPRDIVARLRKEMPDVNDLDYMGDAYVRARYGRKELTQDEHERLSGVWKQARNTLLARLLRWK